MNHIPPDHSPPTPPRHLAVIMDGNGRWAQAQGLPRISGHRQGAKTVDLVTMECARLGMEALTLYSFSSENWKRPTEEVDFLMELCKEHLITQQSRMVEHDIRFRRLGRRNGLPAKVLEESDACEEATRNCGGMTLSLALNYGSRAELADAARSIAEDAAEGRLDPKSIDEATVSNRLDTAGLPDPDLLLRTAGEMRISNFLLWQISYAELVVTDVLWPAFEISDLHQAFADFGRRDRRFGLIDSALGENPDPNAP